ncbi:putative RNA binding protein YcfA (HicA-like mRNA interferase family) [Hoeflea marina]|uniref:Putative RNA binding protein YcfA (HicA-like mRNA interferase family) n=1 Tax=Hoeflea marina TaxID=274592 RepID=A0A317PMQ4_9HYPH|nr:type II toxin-antitoxin system HicA family toxin [Hoeflea marina]PWW02225.1 putative RNA binding protein YcfA (HicA-like mRNA interferase family) [Hoeflea marina]
MPQSWLSPEVAPGYYLSVCQALAEAGFRYVQNAKGSHEKWKHTGTGKIILVPHNLKSRHTANAILKDAGLPKKF